MDVYGVQCIVGGFYWLEVERPCRKGGNISPIFCFNCCRSRGRLHAPSGALEQRSQAAMWALGAIDGLDTVLEAETGAERRRVAGLWQRWGGFFGWKNVSIRTAGPFGSSCSFLFWGG